MNKGDTISKEYLLAEIDDLADEFSEIDENGLHSERWCGIMDAKGVIANAPSVSDKSQEWIPCSERLPEEEGEYLATFHHKWPDREYKTVEVEEFRNGKFDENLYMKVVAWMPRPKPWKGADDETD